MKKMEYGIISHDILYIFSLCRMGRRFFGRRGSGLDLGGGMCFGRFGLCFGLILCFVRLTFCFLV